ncbi:hypothetical protein SALBM311S_08020 [Streptomyces alboniger]
MVVLYRPRLLTAAAAACALVLTSSSVAQAGAVGSTPVRTFEYSVGGMTMKVPTGCLFTYIVRGSGNNGVRRVSQCHHITK